MNGMNGMNIMGGNPIDMLKNNLMSTMMLKNLNGASPNSQSGFQEIIWLFIVAQFADFIIRHIPILINFVNTKINAKFESTKNILENATKDVTDNKYKVKSSSITIHICISDVENVVGQALLDYITNNKNTLHVAYTKRNFIINQTDVINLEEDIFAKMSQENQGADTDQKIVQVIEIYSFNKTTEDLRKFLDCIKTNYQIAIKNKLGNKRFFFNVHPMIAPTSVNGVKDFTKLPPNFVFVMKEFQTNRKFTNLFGEEIVAIRNRVEFFTRNKKWYDEKGIPYTLGLLLSGDPGTGKTSTIKCLANETKRHIFNINLNNDITKIQLENLFFNETVHVLNHQTMQSESFSIPLNQRIYVLEDVDCQSNIVKERNSIAPCTPIRNPYIPNNPPPSPSQNKMTPQQQQQLQQQLPQPLIENTLSIDLSFLLNLLDGVLENPGRIIIMTSNLPDTLDSALIRPGRIDIISKFNKCTNATIIEMIQFFYDTKLSKPEIESINKLREKIITPAQLGKVMFENFKDYNLALNHLTNLSKQLTYVEQPIAEVKNEDVKYSANIDVTCSDNIDVANDYDSTISQTTPDIMTEQEVPRNIRLQQPQAKERLQNMSQIKTGSLLQQNVEVCGMESANTYSTF